jgi:glycosyltransferase involved in cell wall biosynthesis
MKIIFVDAVQNFGGASKSTLELANRLINIKNEVLIIDFWGCCKPYIEKCIHENIPYQILDPRSKPIMLSNSGILKKIYSYIKYIKTNHDYKRKMHKIITLFKPNLIIVNNTKTLAILNKSNEYKIVFFARGWFLPDSFGFLERFLFKNVVDKYICISQATRHMVFASGFAPLGDIFVISSAIEMDRINALLALNDGLTPWFKSAERSRDFVIMHCGSFIESKGQHIVLDIFKKLLDRGENVKLLLVGMVTPAISSKKYYDLIINKIKEKSLDSNIEIVLNESDVLMMYKNIDLLIHPSYSEGLPRVVLEAMAFGKPVVGNPVGGIIDLVINNYTGYLCNFNAVDEYVNIIQNLIADKDEYEFVSKNASALIEKNYTIKHQVSEFMKLENIFEKVCNEI